MNLIQILFSFEGRINRARYWGATAGVVGAMFVVSSFLAIAAGGDETGRQNINTVVMTIMTFPTYAIGAKRLHDRGKSGWWLLIQLTPLVFVFVGDALSSIPVMIMGLVAAFATGLWLFIELGCLRGTVGPNRFGPDPLDRDSTPAVASMS